MTTPTEREQLSVEERDSIRRAAHFGEYDGPKRWAAGETILCLLNALEAAEAHAALADRLAYRALREHRLHLFGSFRFVHWSRVIDERFEAEPKCETCAALADYRRAQEGKEYMRP